MQASEDGKWQTKKGNRQTVGNAYSSAQGQDPTGPGDAFTADYVAEASATSSYNGVYYNDGGLQQQGRDAGGGWPHKQQLKAVGLAWSTCSWLFRLTSVDTM